MTVAVLGGGAVGKTVAADCKLAGLEVRLFSRSEKSVKLIDRTGIELFGEQRNLYGFERSGRAFLDYVGTDMSKAVSGADTIVIAIPALAHEDYLRMLVPLLEDGQTVHVMTDNYCTLVLRRLMREMGYTAKVVVGGWSSAPYGTRIETVGGYKTHRVGAKYRAITLRGCALPASDNDAFLKSAASIPCFDSVSMGDGFVVGDTVLDIGFSNVNPVIHVPASVLGVSSMENWTMYGNKPGSYSMYSHGLCPSIAKVQWEFYQEEKTIADAIGIDMPSYAMESFCSRRTILAQEYMGLDENGHDNAVWPLDQPCDEGNVGPDTVGHRYFTEDIPVGCKVYHDLGERFGVSTPVIDSMIVLGGVMCGSDYFKESRYDLDYIGIGGMGDSELLGYLRGN